MSVATEEGSMKLYRIWQTVNNDYDTYDSAVVAARDEEDARSIHPQGIRYKDNKPVLLTPTWQECGEGVGDISTWTFRKNVMVEYLGEGSTNLKRGVVCASFNAG